MTLYHGSMKRPEGLYKKFVVFREDGQSGPAKKHYGCEYFVLDLTHDLYAIPAIVAYIKACEPNHPLLAKDLRDKLPTLAERERHMAVLLAREVKFLRSYKKQHDIFIVGGFVAGLFAGVALLAILLRLAGWLQ